jgi:excisionase family DNA binding protein
MAKATRCPTLARPIYPLKCRHFPNSLLGISRAFAYELVARGELPVIRLGRRIVVPKVALLAMVDLSGHTN